MKKRLVSVVLAALLAGSVLFVLGACESGTPVDYAGTYYLSYVEDSSGTVIAEGSTVWASYPRTENYYDIIDSNTLRYAQTGENVVTTSYTMQGNTMTVGQGTYSNPWDVTLRNNEIVEPGLDGNYVFVKE